MATALDALDALGHQEQAQDRAAGLDTVPEIRPAAPAPAAAPAAPKKVSALDALDRVAEQTRADDEAQRQMTALQAAHTDWPAEKHRDVALYSAASGKAPEEVASNLDAVKAATDDEHVRNALATRPWLSEWLAKSPSAAAAVKDDIANAGWLEWAFTGRFDRVDSGHVDPVTGQPDTTLRYTGPAWARAVRDSFTHGQKYVYLSAKQAAGQTTPEEDTEIGQLEKDEEKDYVGPAAAGLWGTLRHQAAEGVIGLSKSIPYVVGREGLGLLGQLAGQNIGMAAAGGAAVETGPGEVVAVPAGAVVGGKIGRAVTTGAFDFYQTIGPTYRSLRNLKGRSGDPLLTDAEARTYAVATSLATSALMQIPGGAIGQRARAAIAVGPLKRLLTKTAEDGAAGILSRAAVRTAEGEFRVPLGRLGWEAAKDFGKAEMHGFMLMGVQSGLNEAARQAAYGTHGEEWSAEAPVRAFVEGGLRGARDFALLSAVAPVRAFLRDRGASALSIAEANRNLLLTDVAEKNPLFASLPQEAKAELAKWKSEHGAVQDVYVHRDALDGLAKERGVEARDLASKVAEDGGRAYDEATSTGSDFVKIPAEKYYVNLAGTKELLDLRPDVKLSQESRTPRQEFERVREEAELEKAASKAETDARETVRQDVIERAINAGRTADDANRLGEIVSRSLLTFARKEGKGRNALDLWQESPLRMEGALRDAGPGAPGEVAVHQGPAPGMPEAPAVTGDPGKVTVTREGKFLVYKHEGSPLTLRVSLETEGYHQASPGLKLPEGIPETEENLKLYGGKWIATALYMRALADAQAAGKGWQSDWTRGGGTPAMYDRFEKAGAKIQWGKRSASRSDRTYIADTEPHVILPEEVKALNLDTFWKTIQAQGEIRRLRIQWAEEEIARVTGGQGEVAIEPPTETSLKQGERGRLVFKVPNGQPREFKLQFLNADESTGVHEVAHYLGEVLHDLASAEGASPDLKAEYGEALKFMGYANAEERAAATQERAEIGQRVEKGTATAEDRSRLSELTAKEEKLSHAFEQYLAEGKAPVAALAGLFRRMKLVMLSIYRGVVGGAAGQYREQYGRDLELSDEMRRFFDRTLAAEDETENARAQVEDPAAFEDVYTEATAEERAEHARLVVREKESASRELLRRIVEDERRETTKWFKEEREKTTAEVEAGLASDPTYKALRFLWHGVLIGSEPVPGMDVAPADLSREAQRTLASASLPEALRDEKGRPVKLDRSAVATRYNREFVDQIPREWFAKKGGVDADTIAEAVGFSSGDEMLRSAVESPRPSRLVENEVQRRMEERFGRELLTDPGALGREAMDAIHDEAGAKRVLLEMRILARKLDPSLPARMRGIDLETIRGTAERLIGEKLLADMNPSFYLAAERGAAERALKLAGEGKVAEAYDQKELQLFNRYLYRAARDARLQATRDAAAIAPYTTDAKRREVGLAIVTNPDGSISQPYLDKVDALLNHFEFRKVSGTEMLSRQGLLAWLDEQRADNRDVVIPDRVLAKLERPTSWKELQPGDLSALREAVESIAHQAKLKRKLTIAGEEREQTEIEAELDAAARANLGEQKFYEDRGTVPALEAAKRQAVKIGHALLRPEELFRRMDGGKVDGPWSQYVWKPVNDAYYDWLKLVRDVVKPIRDTLETLPAEEKRRLLTTRFTPESQPGQSYTMEAALAVALNWGSASNAQKLVAGRSAERMAEWGMKGWTEGTAEEFLSKLDRKHWDLVQGIWDQLESMWPKMAELEKRLTGLAPPKIEARPVTRWFDKDGRAVAPNTPGAEAVTYRGGYYPVAYDRRMSAAGARQSEAADIRSISLFGQGYQRAATPQGHLEERNESFSRPIALDLDTLPRHINQAAKDVAMREALIGAHRLLTSTDVRRTLQQTIGEDGEQMVLKWLRDTANELVIPDGGEGAFLRLISNTRSGMNGAVFAFNVSMATQNIANIANAFVHVPTKHMMSGLARFARERSTITDWIKSEQWFDKDGNIVPEGTAGATKEPLSREMLHRSFTQLHLGQDVREAAGREGALGIVRGKLERMKEVGMIAMKAVDAGTAYPTWLGAYEHASTPTDQGGLGLSARTAADHADRVVRLALHSSTTKDLPALMRSPKANWLTMFMGFANTQLNLLTGAAYNSGQMWNEGQKVRALGNIVKGYMLLAGGYAIADAFTGKGPEKDDQGGDEGFLHWFARKTAMAPVMWIPILSSIVRSKEQGGRGELSLTPFTRVWSAAADAAIADYKLAGALTGEDDVTSDQYVDSASKTLQSLAYLTGLPVAQARATGTYAYRRFVSGEEGEEGPGETAWGLAFGPKKPGRLSQTLFGDE